MGRTSTSNKLFYNSKTYRENLLCLYIDTLLIYISMFSTSVRLALHSQPNKTFLGLIRNLSDKILRSHESAITLITMFVVRRHDPWRSENCRAAKYIILKSTKCYFITFKFSNDLCVAMGQVLFFSNQI